MNVRYVQLSWLWGKTLQSAKRNEVAAREGGGGGGGGDRFAEKPVSIIMESL